MHRGNIHQRREIVKEEQRIRAHKKHVVLAISFKPLDSERSARHTPESLNLERLKRVKCGYWREHREASSTAI